MSAYERLSFWKSCVGVNAPEITDRQNPVRESFCYFLVGLSGTPFVIQDAAADPRTSTHPSVGYPSRRADQRGVPWRADHDLVSL